MNNFPKEWKALVLDLGCGRRVFLVQGEMRNGTLEVFDLVDIVSGTNIEVENLTNTEELEKLWYSTVGEGDFLHPFTMALATNLAYPSSNMLVETRTTLSSPKTLEDFNATIKNLDP